MKGDYYIMSTKIDLGIILQQFWFGLAGIEGFNPNVSESDRGKEWSSTLGPTTCWHCAKQDGKIFDDSSKPRISPPVHEKCKCRIIKLSAIKAGTATIDGEKGADYILKNLSVLPPNYIDKKSAAALGWKSYKGNLCDIVPNGIIGGDIYYNDDGKLPLAPKRIWREADINYIGGYRNTCRLLYSNDGLMFVTYDHFITFYEIN